jgi:hypothetical protein
MNTTWSRRILVGVAVGVCLLGVGALEVLSERVRVDRVPTTLPQLNQARTEPSWDSLVPLNEPSSPEIGAAAGDEASTPGIARNVTDAVQKGRLTVLEVDEKARRLVSLNAAGRVVVGDVNDKVVVVTEDRKASDLALLKPGDVIRVEPRGGAVRKIVVLRHGWHDMTSPEQ